MYWDREMAGLGVLGNTQLEWLEKDLKGLSSSTPIVVFAHVPLWAIYPQWGWGTSDSEVALSYLKRFGSVSVLNGHIHQTIQKIEGNITFHTAMSTAFSATGAGAAPSPRANESSGRKNSGVCSALQVCIIWNITTHLRLPICL